MESRRLAAVDFGIFRIFDASVGETASVVPSNANFVSAKANVSVPIISRALAQTSPGPVAKAYRRSKGVNRASVHPGEHYPNG
jgi:hypothetical protein